MIPVCNFSIVEGQKMLHVPFGRNDIPGDNIFAVGIHVSR